MDLLNTTDPTSEISAIKLSFIELPAILPFDHSTIQGSYEIQTKSEVTLLSATHIFIAQFVQEAQLQEVILAEEYNDGSFELIPSFPKIASPNQTITNEICLMDINIGGCLNAWNIMDLATTIAKKVRFFIKIKIEVKETLGTFNPTAIQEIKLI